MSRLLLCTDLDRTLLPNGPEPEAPGARRRFARLAACGGVRLAYVSGRGIDLVEEAIGRWDVPVPDLVIADVGATIASSTDGGWQRWPDWDTHLAADWEGMSHDEFSEELSKIPGLTRQEESGQGMFKLSYYTPDGEAGRETVRQARKLLADTDVRFKAVWSMDEPRGVGLLDVLPEAAGKRLAIEHVRRKWAYPLEQVVFAGDSGNDLDVLASPIPAVLVANAPPDVKREARQLASAAGCAEALYIAEGGKPGMNGNYAAGILEGLLHYQPGWAEALEAGT